MQHAQQVKRRLEIAGRYDLTRAWLAAGTRSCVGAAFRRDPDAGEIGGEIEIHAICSAVRYPSDAGKRG